MIERRPRRPRQRVLGPWDSRAPLRHKAHGLTADEVDALAALQGHACAICGKVDEHLQIDHDHRIAPGRIGTRASVRGLLCPKCNSALGWIGDRNIPALIRYLQR
jgi:5-methylcytosine-specific restriction endonuclease McrA